MTIGHVSVLGPALISTASLDLRFWTDARNRRLLFHSRTLGPAVITFPVPDSWTLRSQRTMSVLGTTLGSGSSTLRSHFAVLCCSDAGSNLLS